MRLNRPSQDSQGFLGVSWIVQFDENFESLPRTQRDDFSIGTYHKVVSLETNELVDSSMMLPLQVPFAGIV